MINFVESVDELKKEIENLKLGVEIDDILRIDIPFMESEDEFTILNIPSYGDTKLNLVLVSKNKIIAHSSVNSIKFDKKYEKLVKKKKGESTVLIMLFLKSILKNYSKEFLRIRDRMNQLESNPNLDLIEECGMQLRKLTDRLEGLLQIIIELKEEEVDCFDSSIVQLEYELFSTEARYWLERGRSHNYRTASLRTKSEMKSNRELNDTMKKLTVIMTFLTIVSIVVNVPGTVGAIFGIPALSNAYFENHVMLLVATLVFMTALSVLLGFIYWKSLKLGR